jgi:hypothetical protein
MRLLDESSLVPEEERAQNGNTRRLEGRPKSSECLECKVNKPFIAALRLLHRYCRAEEQVIIVRETNREHSGLNQTRYLFSDVNCL